MLYNKNKCGMVVITKKLKKEKSDERIGDFYRYQK